MSSVAYKLGYMLVKRAGQEEASDGGSDWLAGLAGGATVGVPMGGVGHRLGSQLGLQAVPWARSREGWQALQKLLKKLPLIGALGAAGVGGYAGYNALRGLTSSDAPQKSAAYRRGYEQFDQQS